MKTRTPIFLYILITIGLTVMAFEMFAHDSGYFSSPFFWSLMLIIVILLLIMASIGDLIENQNFAQLPDGEKAAYIREKNTPYFQKLWNSAFRKQPATEEKDILIDHGFDGITELDNSLPKWWVGLFYFGCIFCAVYLAAFAFTEYAHPDAELNAETRVMLASIKEFERTAPQVTLESAKYNADYITEGQELFKTNCITCHGEGAKGGIGPNLTDMYWINIRQKSLFRNVIWILENGSPNNPAMRPMIKEGTITGRDAEKIAAYIYHINRETAPVTPARGGAAPQGTQARWEDGNL